jgi:acyl-CoA synthetase (NDP forming)
MSEAAAVPPARSAVERLLRPRSVAVVGASVTPGALGAAVLGNLDRFGFAGDIHLVNANRKEINGKPCLASTADLPPGVDCAVLAIPRAGILDAVKGCAARGVGAVIIFSAGFAEAGPDGHALQEEIARIARDHGIVVEGPNCLGFINNVDGIALTFGTTSPEPLEGRRGVGIVSQSGAMATVLHAALRPRGIAVSHAISTGNEAVNGIEDFIDYLLEQDATKVITMIADQIRDPRRFLALAERARAAGKPIVLLHPGRSAAARASAQTHTGAMTGDYDVMRALVTHAGVALVDTLEELLDVSELMIRWPTPPRNGAAVISDSGVFKAMALDFCETVGLDLPPPSPAAAAVLGALAPGLVLPTNPLDTTAQPLVDPQLYRRAMRPMLDDDRYGSLVLAIIMSSPGVNRRKVQPIIDALREWKPAKPVMFAMLGEDAEVAPELIAEFRELGVPYFRSPERALRALARLTQFAARQPAPSSRRIERASARLPAGVIPEHAAKALLKAAGIPVPHGALVRDLDGARRAAASIGYPVALKAQSAALSHKSDAGGVVLRLNDEQALAQGWTKLHAGIAKARPGLALDGVLVEAMAREGLELILGARGDPDWGPVLVVGLGGVLAEALNDVRVLPADLEPAAVAEELLRLKGARLLARFRGAPARDVAAAADIASKLGAFILAHPEIAEIDVNPMVLYAQGEGAVALDALIVTRP